MKKFSTIAVILALLLVIGLTATGCGNAEMVESGRYVLENSTAAGKPTIEILNFQSLKFIEMDDYFVAIEKSWLEEYKDLAEKQADKEIVDINKMNILRDIKVEKSIDDDGVEHPAEPKTLKFETNNEVTQLYFLVPKANVVIKEGGKELKRQLSVAFNYSKQDGTITLDLTSIELGKLVFKKA